MPTIPGDFLCHVLERLLQVFSFFHWKHNTAALKMFAKNQEYHWSLEESIELFKLPSLRLQYENLGPERRSTVADHPGSGSVAKELSKPSIKMWLAASVWPLCCVVGQSAAQSLSPGSPPPREALPSWCGKPPLRQARWSISQLNTSV